MPRKQTEIPGTERQYDEEVSDAASALHKIRTQRMKLTAKESEAAEKLLELLRARKLDSYVDDDNELRVTLRPGKDRVSVTKIKDEDEEQAEAAE